MNYKKIYTSPTDYNISRVDSDGKEKIVKDSEQSPKVQAWLADGNEYDVVPFTYDLDTLKNERKAAVRAESARVILAEYPEYKQRNLTIAKIENGFRGLTVPDYDAMRTHIDTIGTWCDGKETEIENAITYTAVMAVDINYTAT
jgi:hypothetical protein